MQPISLIVLTNNEELHLERCLRSAYGFVSQIIVVDSGSTDRTLEVAKKFGANILTHPFKNQAEQFNWALENADIKGDWVLRLDADEYLTPELAKEIPEAVEHAPEGVSGFFMKRRVYFMGRWIRHGDYYPRWFMRLFRKGKGKSEARDMDEHLVVIDGKTVRLKDDFIDENLKELYWWTQKHNDFSSREVKAMMKGQANEGNTAEDKKRTSRKGFYMRLPLFFRAWWYFTYRYVFRGGFLDGKPGLIFHFLQGFWYRFLIDAKFYEAQRIKE